VLALASALVNAGRGRQRITMERIMPVRDEASGSVVPDYQAYVALAWLRELNLVVQHGRQGYTLPPNGDLQQAIEKSWNALSVQRNSATQG
jgi:hypothetical protein